MVAAVVAVVAVVLVVVAAAVVVVVPELVAVFTVAVAVVLSLQRADVMRMATDRSKKLMPTTALLSVGNLC